MRPCSAQCNELKTNRQASRSENAAKDGAGIEWLYRRRKWRRAVTVNKPPPSAAFYTGDSDCGGSARFAIIAGDVFSCRLLGFNSMSVNARAVGRQGPGG